MRGLFLLVFAASGGAALVYEVTWTRLLTLQMGHGVAAASTVLAAFMGGLAVGSAVGGRVGTRLDRARALPLYAGLELAIAAAALLLPLGLQAMHGLFVTAYANGDGGTAFAALRLISSLLLLSVPAAAMGATFPIASKWMVPRASQAAADAGRLYAANTIGAAMGAVLAGFVLLPGLGLRGATWIGVLLNVIAAAGAFWIHRTSGASTATPSPREEVPLSAPARRARGAKAKQDVALPAGHPVLAALALGLSGFASLTLQVVWTRLLALMLGPTTYAFSTIVAIFIAGLAGGAAIGSRLASRTREPMLGLALCLISSVALALVAAAAVDRALLIMAELVASPEVQFSTVLARQAALVAALLVPMTLAFGAAFPFAVAVAARNDDTVAGDLGFIYAVNTAGAIAGSLLAGFVLIPALGLQDTIVVVVVAVAIGASTLLVASSIERRSKAIGIVISAAVAAACLVLPPWNQLLLSSGAYKYASALQGPSLETALTAGELLYYREGASATVAVRQLTGTRSLAIDGKVDASNAGDMLTQRLLAHVPLLLHPDPKRVAILGLGSGVTLGAALTHPIERAVVLEISPEVVEASRFFTQENHAALDDPRTRLIVGDGRTHLLLGEEQYDVIISEPSNPWMAGIASLFTREFFEAARARLAPGGILCQWAHTYDISEEDLQSILATFHSVFPHGTVWLVGEGDVLMIGSPEPLVPRLEAIAAAWTRPGVAEDLASVGARNPFSILTLFLGAGEDVGRWAQDAPVQTDDWAGLEFTGPISIFKRGGDDNATALRSAFATRPEVVRRAVARATAAEWRARGNMFLKADAFRPAYDDFVRALELDPADIQALEGLIRANAVVARGAETRALLSRLASAPENRGAKMALSRLLASQGAYDEAVSIPFSFLQAHPGDVVALEQLASVLSDVGDTERLAPVVARLRLEAPGSEAARYYAASLFFAQGRPDLAANEARAALQKNPRNAKAHNLLGAALASMDRPDDARRAFQQSIALDFRDPAAYGNLGTLELQAGNRSLAARYFAEALTIDPANEPARQGLLQTSNNPNR